MTPLVVDASVALKWVVQEEDSHVAALLASRELAAPTLLLVECANVLWVKSRRGELTQEEAARRVTVLGGAPVEWVPSEVLLDDAVKLALRIAHPVYDCVYLALATRREQVLVTADRPFAEAVRRHADLASRICLLREMSLT